MQTTIEILRQSYRTRLETAARELSIIAERVRAGHLIGGEGAGLARYCVEIDVCSEALRSLGDYQTPPHRRPSARAVHP